MGFIYVSSAVLLVCLINAQAAVIPKSESDAYGNLPVEGGAESIEDNLIEDDYGSLQDLYPPKPSAKDYYDYKNSYPIKEKPFHAEYVIDTANKVLRLKTSEGPQETKLKPVEETELKKLSAAFAKLLENAKLEKYDWDSETQTESPVTTTPEEVPSSTDTWMNLNPIITVSKTGVSIAFGNETEKDTKENPTVTDGDSNRDSLWDSLARSVDKVLEDELDRRLNTTSDKNTTAEDYVMEEAKEENTEDESSLTKFVHSIWNVMRSSVDYIGAFFSNLMTGGSGKSATTVELSVGNNTNTTKEEEVAAAPPATTAVFALEEDTHHRLPFEEFGQTGRNIDSLFYGRGIV